MNIIKQGLKLIGWLLMAILLILLLDAINTEITWWQDRQIVQRSLQERDSPLLFTIIQTDGVRAKFNDTTYESFTHLKSLNGASVPSVAVLLRIPEKSTVRDIATPYFHFSRLGVVNFYLEYTTKEYQRISFEEKQREDSPCNELTVFDEEVLLSGRKYLLDEKTANDIRSACDSNSDPVAILCWDETSCGTIMKLIRILNLNPHRKLFLRLRENNGSF